MSEETKEQSQNTQPTTSEQNPFGVSGNNNSLYNLHVGSNSLPNFWHSSPKLWFKQSELIMASARISNDDSRFNHIVKHLNESQSSLVSDIILNPPQNNKYNCIKEALIKRSEESEMRRIQSVLQTVEMGNNSPSGFHRQLVNMAGDSSALSVDLIKKLWISRLPPTIGAILIGMEQEEISKLYEVSDRIWGMNNAISNPFCNVLDNKSSTSKHSNENFVSQSQSTNFNIHELVQSINELKTRFDRFESRSHFPNRSRDRSQSRYGRGFNRSKSQSRNRRQFAMCWYHYKFGEKAKNCSKPDCSFKTGASGKSSEN